MRTFADRIKWIQEHSGTGVLSLSDVARKAKVTPAGLSRLVRESKKKRGKTPGQGETLRKIAEGNDVDFDWLVSGQGAPRRGELSALDTVLSERAWSDAAKAAAKATSKQRTAAEWRRYLEAVEAAESTPSPPETGVRASSRPETG